MKKLLHGILLCLFLAAGSHAWANSPETVVAAKEADGNDWAKWDLAQKKGFLDGFLAGSFFVIKEGYTRTRGYSEEKFAEMAMKIDLERDNPVFTGEDLTLWTEMEKELLAAKRNQELMSYMVRGVSKTDIIKRLDAIYLDAANLNIAISDAVYLARMEYMKAGQDEIESALLYLRQGKKNPELLRVQDEKGQLVRTIQFP